MAKKVTTEVAPTAAEEGSLAALGLDEEKVQTAVVAIGQAMMAGADLIDLGATSAVLRLVVDWYELAALAIRRHYGDSWGDIAAPMGMSRQGAQARYDRLSIKVLESGMELPPYALEGAG